MRIAFYAPLKAPTHPVPSGDRRMARLLIAALRAGGHGAYVASRFRSYDGTGNAARQRRLKARGEAIAQRLIDRYRDRSASHRPGAWFTYHVYHKSPDWLGPAVAAALRIPYVVAEASHAPKRAGGPWQVGVEGALAAIGAADAAIGFNPVDAACIEPHLRPEAIRREMVPFLDPTPYAEARTGRAVARETLARDRGLDLSQPWLLVVAMMRPGDKLASYRLLGEALAEVMDRSWCLLVAGDGVARAAVARALAPVAPRVRYLGATAPDALPPLYAAADLYVWPAVGEAYGMALLEAQAAGLPVVAGRTGGVSRVVHHGRTGTLAPPGDGRALAGAIAHLLDDAPRRRAMAAAAARQVLARHDLPTAAWTLRDLLSRLTG